MVTLRLRNAADYCLPTLGAHGTKLGHSWFQWIKKNSLVGWFDNLEKEDMSGHFERMRGWSCCCTLPQECYRLPPTYFWTTWHQNRAILISMKNNKWFSSWFANLEKGEVSGHCEWMLGWFRGYTMPQECCRLPPTSFWTTWHQTRAFLISVNKKNWCGCLVWQFGKRRYVLAFWALAGLIPWLHSATGTLQTTAYLLLDHMAPNFGILNFNEK